MIYTIYIDMVFAINTIMDMVVLIILDRVLLYRTAKRHILTGTVIGDMWPCVASLAPDIPAVVEILGTYVAVSSLMAIAACHLKSPREIIKSMAGTYLVSVVLKGVVPVLYEHTRAGCYAWLLMEAGHGRRIPAVIWFLVIAGAAAACYRLSGGMKELIRAMTHGKGLCRVTMIYGEKRETVTGFIDTGSRLRKPVSSQPVHVAVVGLMKQLHPTVGGMVYVPYQSVGTTSGVLPVVFIDRMEVEQENGRYSPGESLIAITRQGLSPSGEYQILIQKSD